MSALEVPHTVRLPPCFRSGMQLADSDTGSGSGDANSMGDGIALASQDTDHVGFSLSTFDVVQADIWDFNPATDEMDSKRRAVCVIASFHNNGGDMKGNSKNVPTGRRVTL